LTSLFIYGIIYTGGYDLQEGKDNMKFKEESYDAEVPNIRGNIIYFLLDDDSEVVYVGQSTIGVIRPFQHTDKEFSSVKIIDLDKLNESRKNNNKYYCQDISNIINEIERAYINKYQPKYNLR